MSLPPEGAPSPSPDRVGGSSTASEFVTAENRDGAYWITVDRARPANAFNADMYMAIRDEVRRADWDESVRCIVITGANGVFGVGGDLHEILQDVRRFQAGGTELHRFQDNLPFETIRCARKPVIAAVNGMALGAGLTITVVSDISIAVESATFGIPESMSGTMDAFLPYYLYGQVSLPKLKYLMYTGKMIPARVAESLGFITEVVADDQLESRVQEVVAELGQASAEANSEFKRMLARLVPYSSADLNLGLRRTWEILLTEDSQHRLSRFERTNE